MLKSLRVWASMLAIGAISSLTSCNEDELQNVSPKTSQQAIHDGQTTDKLSTESLSPWQDFVAKVRQGKIVDPLGQYVSDAT